MRTDIPEWLRTRLRTQAGTRCGYCHTSSRVTGQPLSVEHIIPLSRGGASEEENLWLSCRRCNEFKGAQVDAVDPETEQRTPLFNPRIQRWNDHFGWSGNATRIIGLTACGRATVAALSLNNENIVAARVLWASVGWHPPAGDKIVDRDE